MASNRILMASSTQLHEHMKAGVAQLDGQHKLVGVTDGARLVNAMMRLLIAKQPPALVVVDVNLSRVSGQSAAVAIRALERASEDKKTPILLYGPDASDSEIKALCKGLGSAVHLKSRDEKGQADQAMRLIKAIERVLAKMGGRP